MKRLIVKNITFISLVAAALFAAACSGEGFGDKKNGEVIFREERGIIGDEVGNPGSYESQEIPVPVPSAPRRKQTSPRVSIDGSLNGYGVPRLWKVSSTGRNFFTSHYETIPPCDGYTRYLSFDAGYLTWYLRNNETNKIYRVGTPLRVMQFSPIEGTIDVAGSKRALFHYESGDDEARFYFFDEEEKSWLSYELKKAASLRGYFAAVSVDDARSLLRTRTVMRSLRGSSDGTGIIRINLRYGGKKKIDAFHPVIAIAYDTDGQSAWREYAAGVTFRENSNCVIKGLKAGVKYRVIVFRPEDPEAARPSHGDLHWVSDNVYVVNGDFTAEPAVIDMQGEEVKLTAKLNDARLWDDGPPALNITGLDAAAVDDDSDGITDSVALKVTVSGRGEVESMRVILYSPARTAASVFAGNLSGREITCELKNTGGNIFTGAVKRDDLHRGGVWQVGAIEGRALVERAGVNEGMRFFLNSSGDGQWLQKYLYSEAFDGAGFALVYKTGLYVKDIAVSLSVEKDAEGPQLVQVAEVSGEDESFFHFIVEYDDENFTEAPGTVTGKIVFSGTSGEDEFQLPLAVVDSISSFATLMTPWAEKNQSGQKAFVVPASSGVWSLREIILWDRFGNVASYVALEGSLYDHYLSFLNLEREYYFLYNYAAQLPVQTWVPVLSIELKNEN